MRWGCYEVDLKMTPADDESLTQPPRTSRNRLAVPLLMVAAAALLGAVFAALSTSDFMAHLDRQVHSIHCSFIPGAGKDLGESGCKTVMMSPYSSFFRQHLWGGMPVSLWALATFTFLAYRALALLWRERTPTRYETRFLVLATLLPVAMSVIYGVLSVVKVGATCKVCVGIYVASAVGFVGALLAHRRNHAPLEAQGFGPVFGRGLLEGVVAVLAVSVAYLQWAPTAEPKKALVGCDVLVNADDTAQVMLNLGGKGESAIEVLDPLCPACKAFAGRLDASGLQHRLELKAVLFPLDHSCNWMVTETLHPGACAVSEALLCASGAAGGTRDDALARELLKWAFDGQEGLRALAAKDEGALRKKLETAFPKVKGCLGGAVVKSKLTKSLRWAVANAIPVLTPQLFVGTARMCDEDTDLGLEYSLAMMLSTKGKAARAAVRHPAHGQTGQER
jgi:uncharacterized membrane protein